MLASVKKVKEAGVMTMAWEDLYNAALLELHPEELRRRLDTAENAMHQRLRELES